MLHSTSTAWDLNQDPFHRAKKSGAYLSTLTTGCSHLWLKDEKRYITGLELLTLHSIPVLKCVAETMCCSQVKVSAVSNTACCFLAGNSMHGASVGTVAAMGLFCTRYKSS